ncbi:hypothetical protein [uncultured Aquimarina sp.]|uniref:hypothetical protein n=1 Tax=uncultured Aquimarina sp. TaxID=575652 RepID=UPI00261D9941|nr:hypothetical protein [uncultured Aquimarina sp.]
MNKNIFYIFILLLINFTYSQTDSLSVSIDTSEITIHEFKEDIPERYSDKDFDYTTAEGEAENILARIINWFFNGLQDIFGIEISPELAEILKNLIYLIFIAIVIYILIRVLAGKEVASFFGKKNNVVAPIHFSEEHIEKIDLDKLIQDALSINDYRLAIRYMYMKTLQELSVKKIIDYHFEKTNSDYQREIKNEQLRSLFKKVSYLYEYIWYGKFDLNQEKYHNAKISFDEIKGNIEKIG